MKNGCQCACDKFWQTERRFRHRYRLIAVYHKQSRYGAGKHLSEIFYVFRSFLSCGKDNERQKSCAERSESRSGYGDYLMCNCHASSAPFCIGAASFFRSSSGISSLRRKTVSESSIAAIAGMMKLSAPKMIRQSAESPSPRSAGR